MYVRMNEWICIYRNTVVEFKDKTLNIWGFKLVANTNYLDFATLNAVRDLRDHILFCKYIPWVICKTIIFILLK